MLPAYLVGADYVQTSNDDRFAGATFSIDLTYDAGTILYLSIDDRANVPADLAWVGNDGWVDTGDSWTRTGETGNPYSVYKLTPGGTSYTFGDQDAGGINFYSIAAVAVPEPSSAALIGIGGIALILRRRK